MKKTFILIIVSLVMSLCNLFGQARQHPPKNNSIDISGFWDSAHHWYDIKDEDHIIDPLPDQKRYSNSMVKSIADNILLFQKTNGGWPKNYDMLAILTDDQKAAIEKTRNIFNTTFDNGTTHSQVEYLAQAYLLTADEQYRNACLKGIDFILNAQYANGGWPQFYPDTSGYRTYITFNDDAMVGVLNVLHHVLQNKPWYNFVDSLRRVKIKKAFDGGIECIVRCQIIENGKRTVWCQQHDNIDFHPQPARNFEPASKCSEESSNIVLLLMDIDNPGKEIIEAIQNAVSWYNDSKILGIRVETVKAPRIRFMYHTADFDKVVVEDAKAKPIWTRFYELKTNRPIFCNRDKRIVYSMAEVERERRTGYNWYNYNPQEVLDAYPAWQKKWAAQNNVLETQ